MGTGEVRVDPSLYWKRERFRKLLLTSGTSILQKENKKKKKKIGSFSIKGSFLPLLSFVPLPSLNVVGLWKV